MYHPNFSKFFDFQQLERSENKIKEGLLIFDAEFSGPNIVKNGMVQLGASFWDLNYNTKNADFLVNINLESNQSWDPFTLTHFWFTHPNLKSIYQTIIEGRGLDQKTAITNFAFFLKNCYKKCDGNIIMGSNRLDIDASWINYYLCKNDLMPLHLMFGPIIRLIDTNSFHQGCSYTTNDEIREFERIEKKNYNANEGAFRHFKITNRPLSRYTHNARDDAGYIAECHALVLSYIKSQKENKLHSPEWRMKKFL